MEQAVDHACDGHPRQHPDHQDQRRDACTEDRDHDEDEEERRHREHAIGEAHEEGVRPSAVETGDRAHHDANEQRSKHGRDADEEGDAAAVKKTAEHIAPELVGAQRMHEARASEPLRGVGRLGRDGPEERPGHDQQRDHAEGRQGEQSEARHDARNLGSIRVYAMSTSRVVATAIPATTTVMPVISG